MKYLHRPNHPKADKFGLVPAYLVYDEQPWVTGVISDSMEPVKHHGTGRIIDSKSLFRADTKASGCIEVGSETIKPRAPIKLDKRQRREDIRRALHDLRNG